MKSLKSYSLLTFVCLLLFACGNRQQGMPEFTPEVPFVNVEVSDVPLYQEFVGQTFGSADVDIQARVDGEITGMYFKEGSYVKKGTLLYTIDPTFYDGKVEQARGQLAEARSVFANAEADLKRLRPLAEMNAVSKRELDAATAKYEAAKAQVSAAEAFTSNQQLERSYCNVTAPIDGIIGISRVRKGDLVGRLSSRSILTTLSATDLIRVRFSVSEASYLKFRDQLKSPDNTIDPSAIETEIVLADGSVYEKKGRINFSDRAIDPTTGTLMIEADFPNEQSVLRPGQFVRIRFVSNILKNAMLVPQRAVQELQGMFQVYVIDKSDTLRVKDVEPGAKIKDQWIVKNLDPADRVALLGNQFIRAGVFVKAVPAATDSSASKN